MSTWQSTWSVIVVLLSYNLNTHAIYHIKTRCESGLCLVLYGSNETLAFGQARGNCTNRNVTAAAVTDPSVQEAVADLIRGVPDVEVWTAGFRLTDTTWKYINGSNFTDSSPIINNENGNCLFLRIEQSGHSIFTGDQCNENKGNSYPVCQYASIGSGSCLSSGHDGFKHKDVCYYVNNTKTTWYDAQNFCHTVLGGDLAYTNIIDADLMEKLQGPIDMWIGVTKHRWRWIPGSGGSFPMRYFNWGSGFDESMSNSRVAISSRNFTWNNTATRLNHFMCVYVDETYTSISATSPAGPDISNTGSESGESTATLETTTANTGEDFPVGAVVGSVSATVLVAVLVVVLYILRKKRRLYKQRPRTTQSHVNEGIKVNTSSSSSEDHEPELVYENVQGHGVEGDYSSVDIGPADNMDQIPPYGEYKPRATKEPSMQSRTSGFSKRNRANPQVQEKDEEIPEVAICAQPNKPMKEKETIDNKKRKAKPTVKTSKSKQDAKKAAKPEVLHMEAPSGDIYAVSARNVAGNENTSDVFNVL